MRIRGNTQLGANSGKTQARAGRQGFLGTPLRQREHLKKFVGGVPRRENCRSTTRSASGCLSISVDGRFQGRSQVTSWLLAIARNKALSALQRRSNEELDEDAAAAIEDPQDNPEVALQNRQKAEILLNCLTQLAPAHREVIDLVYYHEKSTMRSQRSLEFRRVLCRHACFTRANGSLN